MRYRRLRIDGASYFFTVATFARRPIFQDERVTSLLLEIMEEIQFRHPFEVDAQVILPDHLHALWTLPQHDSDYSNRWMLIKGTFSRRASHLIAPPAADGIRLKKREQTVWQRRFWEHLIRDESDFDNHFDYIHYNPVRHGLTDRPVNWPFSTFRDNVTNGRYDADWGSDEMPSFPKGMGGE